MTVKEIVGQYGDKFDIEVYEYLTDKKIPHTDYIGGSLFLDDIPEDMEPAFWDIMGKEEYDSLCTGYDAYMTFDEWTDGKGAVLVIIMPYHWMDRAEAFDLAQQIRESSFWDRDLMARLCELADMTEEWEDSDDSNYKYVTYRAAGKLGVDIGL